MANGQNRTPSLWANSTNRAAKLWNLTWDQYLSLDGAVWKAILIALISITAMWIFNISELRGVNVLLTILGYLGIWWFGMRPTHVALSGPGGGIFAALFDRDKSQGIATGPRALYGLVKDISYIELLVGFGSFTWDFSGNPVIYWLVFIGIAILIQTGERGRYRNMLIGGYVLGCIIIGLWTTTGVYAGRAFDPETGATLYMVDPTTGRIDSQGRSPGDCTKETRCFSAETGQELVPMTKEQALKRSPGGIADRAIAGISGVTASVSDLGADAVSAVTGGGSNCPKSAPCPAYAGYELNLTADKPLTYRLSTVARDTGLEVKVTNRALRALVHDSKLFKINQQLGTQVFTITPEPGFAEYVKGGVLHLKMYPLGQGYQVAQEYGVYNASGSIDLTPA